MEQKETTADNKAAKQREEARQKREKAISDRLEANKEIRAKSLSAEGRKS